VFTRPIAPNAAFRPFQSERRSAGSRAERNSITRLFRTIFVITASSSFMPASIPSSSMRSTAAALSG
jgi:hypothetical protein